MPELWLLMGACVVVTYMWRGLGVLFSGRIATDSDVFDWITCVAYAMVAALIVRIIVMPTGLLASSLLAHRLIACGVALIVFYVCHRNLFVGVGAGAMVLTALNHLQVQAG